MSFVNIYNITFLVTKFAKQFLGFSRFMHSRVKALSSLWYNVTSIKNTTEFSGDTNFGLELFKMVIYSMINYITKTDCFTKWGGDSRLIGFMSILHYLDRVVSGNKVVVYSWLQRKLFKKISSASSCFFCTRASNFFFRCNFY